MSLIQHLTHRDLIRQYASVIEQILMSGSNMLASIVVLKVADIASFGIYSFIFVLSTLVSGVFGTLLHRQMMLEIAADKQKKQENIFLATIAIEMAGLLIFLCLLAMLLALLSYELDLNVHPRIAAAGALYVVLYILFDAFKQYSYTTGNQVYSLRSTSIYVCVQVIAMGMILIASNGTQIVEIVYLTLAASLAISLLSNRLCLGSLSRATWDSWHFNRQVLGSYFKQGRFSLLGMSITWAQNQSINPFLMLLSGPTVTGYYSLGRLLIMPMAVVSQGLVNSSTPTLRRLYKKSGTANLMSSIHSYLIKTTVFSFLYVVVLLLAHSTGLMDHFIPDYHQVQWYLLVWVVLSSCSIVRFWHGQYFVVSMDFLFLLRTSIIALAFTATGMVIFGFVFESIKLALMSVIAGELVALFHYRQKQRSQLRIHASDA